MAPKKNGTYGTLGAPQEASSHEFQWMKRGDCMPLLIAAVVPVCAQVAPLSIIAVTVFTTYKLFVPCDADKLGFGGAVVCECSKASMRCFPLLAIVVSLIIAKRGLIRHRMFYEMLRRGYMLDFTTASPLTDPLFIFLILGITLGSMQLVLIYLHTPPEKFMAAAQATGVTYFAPAGAFLAFLAQAYDTESQLLPFSKYMDEDPVTARKTLSKMPVVPEDVASAAVHQGLCFPKGKEDHTIDECLAQLVTVTGAGIGLDLKSVPELMGDVEGGHGGKAGSSVGFVAEMWPAVLLLDRRVIDTDSVTFKKVWNGVCAIVFVIAVLCFCFFVKAAAKDVQDVREGSPEDGGGLLVEATYAATTLFLLVNVFKVMPS